MEQRFIHLHLHSEFSMLDGIVRIKPLMKSISAFNSGAVAVTDQSNLFAVVKVFKSAMAHGVKPILGAEVSISCPENKSQSYKLLLLCKNLIGYKNLTVLLSRAYQEGQRDGMVLVESKWLEELSDGLIALSAGLQGQIGKAFLSDNSLLAEQQLHKYLEIFPGSFYLEVQRTKRFKEEEYNQYAIELSEKFNVPLVATNDVRFIDKTDFYAHEARVCIHDGYVLSDSRREKKYSEEQYLKSPEEMCDLFKDIPSALKNTVEIAKRCNVILKLGENYLPEFPTPEGMNSEQYFAQLSKEGLEKRLVQLFPTDKINSIRKAYDERLQIELDVINRMGFSGYFLIVADFISWAKEKNIPVGPGRGSGAGSLVAYALQITDLDPLEYELLFERFLNPERVSMPDFDIDFCMEGRDRVIDYVAQRYGRKSVSQIITFGTMAAKAVIRDVGRVLDHPYGFVDRIAKLIPFEIGITLDKALEQEEALKELYDTDSDVHELIELAKKLEGITRNAGKHAGGVVISPSELTDFAAIYCEQDSQQIVSQLDKDDVESVGLVKFDFLGLRTLTIINWAVESINSINENERVDITKIPTDDKLTFDLLKDCNTTAVFQLESRGMKDLISRLKPDCFEEIIALVALFRPGPLQSGMVDDFIDRKHGRAKVQYPHPALEPILKTTYGVILYQEQVMQIAQVLAKYSLGAADMLRRAMGKKKPEEMAKQREIFIKGALENQVDEQTAISIFDLMEKFAGYGFNKSHSAAYALVAYQTAWLKAHYPAPFMAAVLSSDMDNTDKVVNFIEDCKQHNLNILPPSINSSDIKFTASDDKTIRYGLGAIKGVGESALLNIIENRNKSGKFTCLFNFCERVELRKVNRKVIDALICSGALDDFGIDRAILQASLAKAFKVSEQRVRNTLVGQFDLFSSNKDEEDEYIFAEPWPALTRLSAEKDTLGLYLTGHPVDEYFHELQHYTSSKIYSLRVSGKKIMTIAGLVTATKRIITKRGSKMMILTVDDGTGRLDIAIFSELLEEYESILQKNEILVVEGEVSNDEFSGGLKMAASRIFTIEMAREHFAKKIIINVDNTMPVDMIYRTIGDNLGSCPIQLQYNNDDSKVLLHLGRDYGLKLDDNSINSVKSVFGDNSTRIVY